MHRPLDVLCYCDFQNNNEVLTEKSPALVLVEHCFYIKKNIKIKLSIISSIKKIIYTRKKKIFLVWRIIFLVIKCLNFIQDNGHMKISFDWIKIAMRLSLKQQYTKNIYYKYL